MKKNLLTGVTALLMLSIVACEGPMGPEGPAGINGTDGVDGTNGYANYLTYTYDIDSWTISDDKSYYWCSLNVPELTQTICYGGLVNVYLFDGSDNGNDIQVQMPCTRHYVEKLKSASGADSLHYYTVTWDYDMIPGFFTIFNTRNDFNTVVEPDKKSVRLAFMWNDSK